MLLWPDGVGSDAQGGLDFTAVTSKGATMNLPAYIVNWPGKSGRNGGPEHPAVYHMLDVAAVAEILIAREDFPAQVRDALALLVGLHDLGKVGIGFRAMIREGLSQTVRHWELSEAWLTQDEFLAERLQADPWVMQALIGAVAGHHGRPSRQDERFFSRMCLSAGAAAGADVVTIARDFAALWPEASLKGIGRRQAAGLGWWLAGLTNVADWVGSNAEWFPAREADLSLIDYLELARPRARRAVPEAGLGGAEALAGSLFDFRPRPMQAAAVGIDLPEGPVLAVIEDETGAGKTEAALVLAQRMLLAGKGRGLFFGLPTTATADAMFRRAASFAGRLMRNPALTLAHGRAGLSVPFRDLVAGRAETGDEVTATAWLADNSRRALLADIGIGTIDQALLAVMRARFSALRLWGLSSKILIVDEAHEIQGDGYMAALLETLLRVHAGQGGSAILLSATLPLAARNRLSRAFAEGAGRQVRTDASRAYPALSVNGAVQGVRALDSAKGAVGIVCLPEFDNALNILEYNAKQGAACLWVRNAVDDAIQAVEALRVRGVLASLLHARFALCDRKRIEAAELARFGRDGVDRAGRVLVATQVVESSLDLDFDVMVSDLAPMAALIQRAGRLWRHMDMRPREARPVAAPVLHVLSPDPAEVRDDRWLREVLGAGAWVYPLDLQWRTADLLFRAGEIRAPEGLRDLIEPVHGDGADPIPEVLERAERERIGEGYARRSMGDQNVIDFRAGYRGGASGADDAHYPTRLGRETRKLALARWQGGCLVPWAGEGTSLDELWQMSELSAAKARLDRLPLPDQASPAIAAAKRDWPEWRRDAVTLCPVEDGVICEGLTYDGEIGLSFVSPIVR